MEVLRDCSKVEGGLPASVKAKMALTMILDFGIGLVPVIGDFADVLFHSNTKIAHILEKHLYKERSKIWPENGIHHKISLPTTVENSLGWA